MRAKIRAPTLAVAPPRGNRKPGAPAAGAKSPKIRANLPKPARRRLDAGAGMRYTV
jgi:hypothetical protein